MVAGTWRGQPLAALVLILAGWVAVRAILWETGVSELPVVAGSPRRPGTLAVRPAAMPAPSIPEPVIFSRSRVSMGLPVRRMLRERYNAEPRFRALVPSIPISPPLAQTPAQGAPSRLAALDPPLPVAPVASSSSGPQERRWSADGWAMLRGGGDGALAAGGGAPATYGASQAGAVLRYRLAPASPHRPVAYLRATAALNGSDEREAALGVSARPLAALPVIAGVEMRAAHRRGGLRLRPAVLLVSELPVIALPAALQAEAYAQAGYVGGRFATAFADGQVRIDRSAGKLGRARLTLGAGAWGGAQKGVARLDVGPAMRLAVPLGPAASARIGVDWRLRVAGNAAPSSGPALTLSAGF